MKIKKFFDDFIDKNDTFYEYLYQLNNIQEISSVSALYEARNNQRYIKNNIINSLLKSGRINLNGISLKNNDDIVVLAKLIGDRKFETSRIIYVKDGIVVGADNFTIDKTTASTIYDKQDKIAFYKINDKQEKLNADGYFFVHNHPSGDSSPSFADKKSCQALSINTNGFIKGIVVGKDNFTILTVNRNTTAVHAQQFGEFQDNSDNLNYPKILDYLKEMQKENDCSYIFYLDNKFKLLNLQEIKNIEFRDQNIFNYIANEKKKNGATLCYLYTMNDTIYDQACRYVGTGDKNLFVDAFYSDSNDKYKSAMESMEYLGLIVRDEPLKTRRL